MTHSKELNSNPKRFLFTNTRKINGSINSAHACRNLWESQNVWVIMGGGAVFLSSKNFSFLLLLVLHHGEYIHFTDYQDRNICASVSLTPIIANRAMTWYLHSNFHAAIHIPTESLTQCYSFALVHRKGTSIFPSSVPLIRQDHGGSWSQQTSGERRGAP